MNKKYKLLFLTLIVLLAVSGCSLARPAARQANLDRPYGVWIIVKDDKIMDETDLDGYKAADAIVIKSELEANDGDSYNLPSWSSQGAVAEFGVMVNTSDDEEKSSTTISGTIYIIDDDSSQSLYYKVAPLYEKPDGTTYADISGAWTNCDGVTQSISTTDVSVTAAANVSGSENVQKETVQYKISAEVIKPVTEISAAFFTEDYKLLATQKLPLSEDIENQTLQTPDSCDIILVRETLKAKNGTSDIKCTSYTRSNIQEDADEPGIISHISYLPTESLVAKPVTIKFQL